MLGLPRTLAREEPRGLGLACASVGDQRMLLPSAPQQQHDRNLTGPMQRGLLGSRAQQENPATGAGGGGVPQRPNDNVLMSWTQGLGQGFCAHLSKGEGPAPRQASRWAGCPGAGLWDRMGTRGLTWSSPQRAEQSPC